VIRYRFVAATSNILSLLL